MALAYTQGEDFLSHVCEREDRIHCPELHCLARHAPHYTGLLVLHYGIGASLVQLLEATRTVIPHAGEQHTNGLRPKGLGHGTEQHVYRWPMAVHRRPIVQLTHITCVVTPH